MFKHRKQVLLLSLGSKLLEREYASIARHLGGIANNTRFLILPWVRVPRLASHILSQVCQRIRQDWQAKYAPPPVSL